MSIENHRYQIAPRRGAMSVNRWQLGLFVLSFGQLFAGANHDYFLSLKRAIALRSAISAFA